MLQLAWVSLPQQNYRAPNTNNASAEKAWSHSTTLAARVSSARSNSHPLPLLLSQCSRNKVHSLKWFKTSTACFQSPPLTKLASATWVCPSQHQVLFPQLGMLLFVFTVQGAAYFICLQGDSSWSSHLLPVQLGLPLQPASSFVYFTVVIVNLHVWLIHWSLPFAPDYGFRIDTRGWLACWCLFSHISN